MPSLREEDLISSCSLAGEKFFPLRAETAISWIPGMRPNIAGIDLILHHSGDMKRYLQCGGDPSAAAVHFLTFDSGVIEPMWNPKAFKLRADKLQSSGFNIVVAPDFSSWADAPIILQMWNFYRSMSVTKDLIRAGFRVIPNVCWSTPILHNFSIAVWGTPHTVLIDANHIGRNKISEGFFWRGQETFLSKNPDVKVVFYGNKRNFCRWQRTHKNSIRCAPRVEVLHELSKIHKKGGKTHG